MKLDGEQVDLMGLNPETMGLFGLSWPEKVASFMYKQLKGTTAAKKMKSFWGAGGKNTTLVKNLHNEYMALIAKGAAPAAFSVAPDSAGKGGTYAPATLTLAANISKTTNVMNAIVLEFLRALFVLARDGKIPYKKWNPKGYTQSTSLRKSLTSEKNILDFAKSTAATGSKVTAIVVGVVGIGAVLYLLTKLKGND